LIFVFLKYLILSQLFFWYNSNKEKNKWSDDMKIIELTKDEYKGYPLSYQYTTKFYYDLSLKKKKDIKMSLKKKKFRKKVEKSFDSKLFEDFVENPKVFAIFDKKKMIAVIEGSYESWNNRFRIWEFLVDKKYRREGYGKALFNFISEYAIKLGSRALVLEVQSCNEPAISFYIDRGLHLIGFDTMSYSNKDIENKEIRLEFGKRLI
jgi:ribosomal protein S18 acetylase RimI-like enzyme